jgi:hypothetical protein
MHSPTPNPLHPDRMTAEERLAEIGRILAAGFLRGRDRRPGGTSLDDAATGEVSLDLPAEGSSHGAAQNRRGEQP